MRLELSARFLARMLGGHSRLGLTAGALLYVLCLSGTIGVFHEELERWETPHAPEFAAVDPAAVSFAAQRVLDGLDVTPHHFYVALPVDGMPRMVVSTDDAAWFADRSGAIVGPVAHGYTDFLLDLHYYLSLRGTAGLTLVGVLGVALLGLIISGLLAHRRIFRDAFAFRLRASAQLREVDLHNRLSVWAAPFHVAIALTGAAIGLSSVLALTIGSSHLGGRAEEFFAPIFGVEPTANPAPAPLADIATALRNFRSAAPDAQPWYVIFHDPGTAGQRGEILAKLPNRMLYGENYYFDAHGTLTHRLGLADGPPGQQLVAGAYPVHFGSFGGLLVKLAYGLLGGLLCVVCASGINIWLIRKRERGDPRPELEGAWAGVVWGTPAALSFALALESALAPAAGLLAVAFWLALLASAGVGARVSEIPEYRCRLRALTAVMLAAALASEFLKHTDAFSAPAAHAVNLVIIALTLAFGLAARLRSTRAVTSGEECAERPPGELSQF